MARRNALLAERWDFMVPWLEILGRRIKYKQVAHEEEVWEAEKRVLEVTLPCKLSTKYERYTQGEFLYDLQEIREALALVAAVAHIDQEAWKFLLNKIWGVKLGTAKSEELEQDIPARFVLVFESMAGFTRDNFYGEDEGAALDDLVFFCGTNQRLDPTPEFQTALRQIAARAGDKILPRGKPGLDVKIPIQVEFSDRRGAMMATQQFMKIVHAEKAIKEQWRAYEQSASAAGVGTRAVRCTFELAPMIVQLTDTYSSRASRLQKLILRDSVWFEKLSLSPGEYFCEIHEARETFRQTVTAVFDCDRRSPQRASSRYYSDRVAYLRDGSPLQVNHVDFSSFTGMMMEDFSAILSALVVNQTAKKFSLRAEKRTIISDKQWKWIAYGLFSKRARAYSATEVVALNQIDALSAIDMEAFLAVLNAEHPEEVICGTPAGVVEDRNATLKSGAAIRWYFSHGKPVVDEMRKEITVESAVRCVRTFSDDGESDWVCAMIPGLGGCQVQREDLIFDLSSAIETRPGALKALTIGFNREEHTSPCTDGLPQLLAAIGSTLKDLTIDGPRDDIDENLIIRHCPNLHTLSLCGGIVDVQLDLTDYRYANQAVPELTCHWHDVQALAADLSDANNPLSKIVRRLRLRLDDRCKGWRRLPGGYDFEKLPDDTKALVRMLTVNRHLEYLDVLMLTDHRKFGTALKKQHRKPIDRPARLSREVKLAFLSVVSARLAPAVPARNKRSRQAVRSGSVGGNGLDQRVVSQIFSFAGPPLLRRVYFRTTKYYWKRDWSDDFYNDEEDDWDSEEGVEDA